MKKIIISLCIISAVSVVTIGATRSYFSDTETTSGNSITNGTLEVAINGEQKWTGNYSTGDMKPGDEKSFTLQITNDGTLPVRIWQIIKNVTTAENGITEPEQAWYNAHSVTVKNDLDSAFDVEMNINGNMAVNKEASFSLAEVKDYYLNLIRLDYGDGVLKNGNDGILDPGETVTVEHKYYFNPAKTGNWAQTDSLSFDIEILAQQVETPEPLKLMDFVDNKYNSGAWTNTRDGILGLLKYESIGQNFDYNFIAKKLPAGNYKLIYYPDPWVNPKTVFLLSDNLNSDGNILNSGAVSFNLGINLPDNSDLNYGHGAKVWLVPNGALSGNHLSWSPDNDNWLFDNWPGLINYTKGDAPIPPVISSQTITINELGGDIGNQYGYQFGGYSTANVAFTYNTPASSKLTGTINATGLKPYATYQVKFSGKPTCAGSGGNDAANEYIGYKGRWTCISGATCTGDAVARNRIDVQYEANKISHNECIVGYLVWDFFTADNSGNASKVVETANSYHVLWSGGGTCNTNVNTYLAYLDSMHPTILFSPADKVDGQIERGVCGGLALDPGTYDLKMVLTEESFHQSPGTWATVLMKDINFVIN